ncbi:MULTISPECIES: hypothetical protein [unclassified Flavobacterium]|uniref:hypothetical protein n=1 Tax=unclassified Flavobacterium TaxID=196869 RepID=UPI0024920BA2|nr:MULTISPECIES: hypothetical protein [unclassified Flavobacterium]MDQ1164566.1 hypothetical protein [Flavobacterium sp. SORGH_AS_0622]BDU25104.1 hypothetical protein FLGSB24_18480 [Flavobacterium sp. GSB-24]
MVVLYKNFFNESISEIQALKMNGYKKEFHDNNVVKKIENKYANGNFHVTYYKDNNESNVLENLSKEYPNTNVFRIRTRQNSGNYTIENEDYIEDGILELKNSLIRDSKGRIIAYNQIDIINNQPLHDGSVKYFYSEDIYNNYCLPNLEDGTILDKDFKVFRAKYDEIGNLIEILLNSQSTYDKEYFFPNQPAPLDLETCRQICNLTNEQMNYFLTDELLPIPNF